MNTNLLNIVKQITDQYGEGVLAEPRRVSALFGDLARDIPAPQRNAFVKCLEHKFTEMLKNVSEADRGDCKQGLAQRLNESEGLDLNLCRDTVELLAAALFGAQREEKAAAAPLNSCIKCKAALLEGAQFCSACGTPVGSGTAPGNGEHKKENGQQTSGKSAEDYFNSGISRNGKGQYDEAIRDFNEAIRLNPNVAVYYSNRGYSYLEKGQHDEAIRDCTEAIRLNPNRVEAYNNRGYIFHAKGQYDEAIRDYTEAIRLNPNESVYYNNRGNSFHAKGQYDEAIRDYTEAIRLNPNVAFHYGNRGYIYLDKNQYSLGIKDYNEALRIDPDYVQVKDQLKRYQGIVCLHCGGHLKGLLKKKCETCGKAV